jgi:hypothetical protein
MDATGDGYMAAVYIMGISAANQHLRAKYGNFNLDH